jgi:DNA ligase D-like protein (predicted 3'-phosphoesterase)
MNPAEKRLAVEVEDHLLEYIDFEGVIPAGNYGAGAVVIWDEGEFELLEARDQKISFVLYGKHLRGGFVLTKLKPIGNRSGKEWLLIKRNDDAALRNWRLELALTEEKKEQLAADSKKSEVSD